MNDLDSYCESLYRRIQTAYECSGNDTGWEMFASPRKVLDGAKVAFLGLNPAGYDFHKPSSSRDFAMKCGESAYVDQIWGGASEPGQNKLQLQIRALFKKIGAEPKDVLAGNLVPFRSPRWKYLKGKKFSLQFGEEIWRDILRRAKPSLVIGMGAPIFPPLCRILNVKDTQSVLIGWGRYKGEWAHFDNWGKSDNCGLLVRIPHLSTFKIMTREQSEVGLRTLFAHWHKKFERK